MRKPTPVTKSIIVIDSGSTWNPNSAVKSPAAIQVKSTCSKTRSSTGVITRPMNIIKVVRNDKPTDPAAIRPTAFLPMRNPKNPLMMQPISGYRGTSPVNLSSISFPLGFHDIEFVQIRRGFVAKQGDNDCKSN